VAGLIVTLSDDGALRLSFLGTDAATAGVVAAEARDLDYDAMNAEHRALQRVVRDTMTGAAAAWGQRGGREC
jgi:Bardet-Biedl syndrome 9 protein